MRNHWRFIVSAIILIAIGGFFIRQKTVSSKAAGQVETAKVKNATFIKSISSSGKTKAQISADLKFQSSGKLIWVGVKEGDEVKKGQVIAQLDRRDVQKTLEKSLKDYMSERNDFEETWRVTYRGIEKPTGALTDTVKRILEKNQWDLDKSVLDVELKHLALEYSTLISPIAGIVTHIDTPISGVNITPATAVFQIIDPTHIVFEAKIDEVDVGNLASGQVASVSLDAYPDEQFAGTIVSISYAAETSAGGATVFPVEIQLSTQKALRVGFNGDVSIDTVQLPDSLIIPLAAIREDGTKKYVFKKTGNTYAKVSVVLGISNEDDVVVKTGLSEGDEVVTKGFTTVEK